MKFVIASNKSINFNANEPILANTSFRQIGTDELYNIIKDMRTRYSPLRAFRINPSMFASNDFQDKNFSVVVFVKKTEEPELQSRNENERTTRSPSCSGITQRITTDILSQFADFMTESLNQTQTSLDEYIPVFTISGYKHSPVFTELRFCAIKSDVETQTEKKNVTLAFTKGLYVLLEQLNSPVLYYVVEEDDPAKELIMSVFPDKYGQPFPSTVRQGVMLQVFGNSLQGAKEKLVRFFQSQEENQEENEVVQSQEGRTVNTESSETTVAVVGRRIRRGR